MATVETSDKTPEWMLLLEKKTNRPHRLAHEVGAGAPCLTCGDKCPGLDLHFWRKLCRNCKCKKEEHDVIDDDGRAQFEILLGAGGSKRKKPGAVLKIGVADVKTGAVVETKKNVPFDWVPPNVSDDLAAEYMQQLPAAKLPISGSDGALYRRQQLERQMPLHDLDATYCHNLTPQEIELLQKYLKHVKSNVVGQGNVHKVPTNHWKHKSYGGPTQYNATTGSVLHTSQSDQSLNSLPNLQPQFAIPRPFRPFNAASNDDIPPPLPSSLPPDHVHSNLRTPGSFVPGSLITSNQMQDVAKSSAVPGQMYPGSSVHHGATQTTPAGSVLSSITSNQMQVAKSSAVPGQMYPGSSVHPGGNQTAPAGSVLSSQPPTDLAQYSNAPGKQDPRFSRPLNAVDPRAGVSPHEGTLMTSQHESSIALSSTVPRQAVADFSRNMTQHGSSMMPDQDNLEQTNSTPGLYNMATNNAPLHLGKSSEIPRQLNSEYEPHQVRNVPTFPTDGVNFYNNNNTFATPTSSLDNAVPNSSQPNLNPSGNLIYNQSHHAGVQNVDRALPNFSQPIQRQSGNLINDRTHDAGLYNNTVNPDNLNSANLQSINEPWSNPSQMAADVRLEHSVQPYDMAGSFAVASDSMPHSAQIMQQSGLMSNDLANQMELLSAEEHPDLSCKQCTETLVAGEIAVFADRAGYQTAWHPKCFVCNTCNELLVDLIYFFNKGNVYCGRHFAEILDLPRCFACDELIFVKEYTVAEGKTFHVKHFCCYECDNPLAGKKYVSADDQPTCLDCYQDIFGKKCHTCCKQIAAGDQRITLKEFNWHADAACFRCNGCSRSLLGTRFVMKEKQPYCNKDCVLAASTQ